MGSARLAARLLRSLAVIHPPFRPPFRSDWGTMEHVTDFNELTPRQREMLEFERTWWQFDEPREDLIRARFGCDADEYYAELNQVLELPGAMAHDPLVVRRFHRRRLRRRRSLLEGSTSQPNSAQQGSAPPRHDDTADPLDDQHHHQQGGANA
jgi:hypothetical protein